MILKTLSLELEAQEAVVADHRRPAVGGVAVEAAEVVVQVAEARLLLVEAVAAEEGAELEF